MVSGGVAGFCVLEFSCGVSRSFDRLIAECGGSRGSSHHVPYADDAVRGIRRRVLQDVREHAPENGVGVVCDPA